MSDVAIIIPARYASTRFPAKPLAPLRGASGQVKTLLQRSIEAGRAAMRDLDVPASLYVATDDARIAEEAARSGADVIMTSESCRNGTERVAEAVQKAGITAEIIINLQGDAPLTPPHFVTALVQVMQADPECGIATPVLRCDADAVANFIADRAAGRVGATTVVANRLGHALYFSKEVIPFTNGRGMVDGVVPVFHHVGLYAYRHAALGAYIGWDMGPLETLEGLEQLRFLENGYPLRVAEVSAPGAVFWELNNPSDTALIEGYLRKMGWD